MKTYFGSLVLQLIFIILICCSSTCKTKYKVIPGNTFSLHANESASLLNQSGKEIGVIKLDSVFNDSRCPEGVNCFTAGKVSVAFTLCFNNSIETENVDFTSGKNVSLIVNSGSIKLLDVLPHPVYQKEILNSDKSVQLLWDTEEK